MEACREYVKEKKVWISLPDFTSQASERSDEKGERDLPGVLNRHVSPYLHLTPYGHTWPSGHPGTRHSLLLSAATHGLFLALAFSSTSWAGVRA